MGIPRLATAAELANGPEVRLTVISGPGEVFVDGGSLGMSRGSVTRSLPPGSYRVWVVAGHEMSLPHPVVLKAPPSAGSDLHLDLAFDACIQLMPVIALICKERWEQDLRVLKARLGVDRAVGVGPQDLFDNGLLIVDEEWRDLNGRYLAGERSDQREPIEQFSPLYLIPLGGGQLAQKRYFFAAGYFAVHLGLAFWHALGWMALSDADAAGDMPGADAARLQIDVSFGVLIGVAVLSVAEALFVGWVWGEE